MYCFPCVLTHMHRCVLVFDTCETRSQFPVTSDRVIVMSSVVSREPFKLSDINGFVFVFYNIQHVRQCVPDGINHPSTPASHHSRSAREQRRLPVPPTSLCLTLCLLFGFILTNGGGTKSTHSQSTTRRTQHLRPRSATGC